MFDTFFGADPELFLVDSSGCVPPAALREDFGHNFIDEKIILRGDSWSLIEDGAATEINMLPSEHIDSFYDRITSAIAAADNFAQSLSLKTAIIPAVFFDVEKYWKKRGEDFRDCVRFGCDPDLDIYSGEYSQEVCADDISLRFGGGHIHMQAPVKNPTLYEDVYIHITKMMDILVGNTATAFDRTSQECAAEKERLAFYGRPGKIRLQDYPDGNKGIEYRTPSNFWLKSKAHALALLTMMNSAYNLVSNPDDAIYILEGEGASSAPLNIFKFDQPRAKNLVSSSLDALLKMRYISYDDASLIVSLI